MNPKKILLVIPAEGGSRTLGETLAEVLSAANQPYALFDCGRYAKGLQSLVQGNAGVAEDILNQTLIVKAIEEEAEIVLVMALCPVTVYTLRMLKKAGKITAHYFAEDLVTERLWQPVAPEYDHFFIIQKGRLAELQSSFNPNTHYLPHAAPPLTPPSAGAPRDLDVVFAGAPYPNRIAFLEELHRLGLSFSIFGDGWNGSTLSPGLRRSVVDGGRWLSTPELSALYRRAKIVINLHSTLSGAPIDLNGDFANPRLFELPLSGALQFVDRRAAVAGFFKDGEELVTFASAAEAKEKADFFLAHPAEAARIAENALRRTREDHSWARRLKEMLEMMGVSPAVSSGPSLKAGLTSAQGKLSANQPLNREDMLHLLAGEILTQVSREEQGYA